jgi:hypothetical protein
MQGESKPIRRPYGGGNDELPVGTGRRRTLKPPRKYDVAHQSVPVRLENTESVIAPVEHDQRISVSKPHLYRPDEFSWTAPATPYGVAESTGRRKNGNRASRIVDCKNPTARISQDPLICENSRRLVRVERS